MMQWEITNPSMKPAAPSKKKATPSKKKVTPSTKKVTPSNEKVGSSKMNVFSMKKNVSTSKLSKNNNAVNKCVLSNIVLDDDDSDKMGDHDRKKQMQHSSTPPTTNPTNPSKHDDQRRIISLLCTSVNKADLFRDSNNEFIEDDDNDECGSRDHFTKAFLGSFPIYKSKSRCSTRLKPLDAYLYIPPFRVKKNEMRKAGFWKDWDARLSRNVDFSAEDIQEDLNNTIEAVIEHFENFGSSERTSSGECSAEAPHKINFNAPYLPSPHDLKALQSLQIKEDSSGLQWKDVPTTYCSDLLAGTRKYGIFSRRESDKMRQNWEDFKKEYRFYDLRPLLGNRTFLLEGNAKRFTFTKVQYLSRDQHIAFIKYLGQGLDNRSILQLYTHASLCLIDHVSNNSSSNKPMTPRELHLMNHFIKKFGLSTRLMEFLLSCKSKAQFGRMLYRYYRFRNCPFNSGLWSSAEVLRLLDSISHSSLKPAQIQRTALSGVYKSAINWNQVMEGVQTRSPDDCGVMFHNLLKQALKLRYYSNAKQDENVQWTAKHELLLIQELCKTTEDSLNRVNFHMLTKRPEFGPFCDDFLKRLAREAIHSRVPVSKRRYFDDALDYLAKEVIPLLSNKIEEHEEVFNTRYLSKAKNILQVFPDYLNKYVIKMFSNLPLHESTNMTEAIQDIGMAVDEQMGSDSRIASRTSLINSDTEETSETIPQSSVDTLSSHRKRVRPGSAARRKRQRKMDFGSSNNSKKKKRKKQRVAANDVMLLPPPRVTNSIPIDVITLD